TSAVVSMGCSVCLRGVRHVHPLSWEAQRRPALCHVAAPVSTSTAASRLPSWASVPAWHRRRHGAGGCGRRSPLRSLARLGTFMVPTVRAMVLPCGWGEASHPCRMVRHDEAYGKGWGAEACVSLRCERASSSRALPSTAAQRLSVNQTGLERARV